MQHYRLFILYAIANLFLINSQTSLDMACLPISNAVSSFWLVEQSVNLRIINQSNHLGFRLEKRFTTSGPYTFKCNHAWLTETVRQTLKKHYKHYNDRAMHLSLYYLLIKLLKYVLYSVQLHFPRLSRRYKVTSGHNNSVHETSAEVKYLIEGKVNTCNTQWLLRK